MIIGSDLPMTGTVIYRLLNSLSINGQSVPLSPTTAVDEYRFSASVQLSRQSSNVLRIEALDRAGNASSQLYNLITNGEVTARFINPSQQVELSHSALPVTLDVIAQITGIEPTHRVFLIINEDAPRPMSVSGSTARLAPEVTLEEGDNTLLLEVRDENDRRAGKSAAKHPQ